MVRIDAEKNPKTHEKRRKTHRKNAQKWDNPTLDPKREPGVPIFQYATQLFLFFLLRFSFLFFFCFFATNFN
jgi:hypothetical protein